MNHVNGAYWNTFSFQNFSSGNEKLSYGKESVNALTRWENLYLNGTTVNGEISGEGKATLISTTCKRNIDVMGNIITKDTSLEGITISGDATLVSTTCKGNINGTGNIRTIGTSLEGITISGEATLVSTTCKGNINGTGNIRTIDTHLKGINISGDATLISTICKENITVTGDIIADNCKLYQPVTSNQSVTLDNCSDVHSVSGNHVTLRSVKVENNVSAVNATIEDSTIEKTLTCASNHLIIKKSIINTIKLDCPKVNREIPVGGNYVRIGAHTGTIHIGSNTGTMHIGGRYKHMGETSTGNFGSGGKNNLWKFDDYGVPLSQSKQASSEKESKPIQTLKLLHNCQVKDVIFEGGNGEIILSGRSKLTGNITGGKIKT